VKRSVLAEGNGIPLDRVLAPANRNDSVLLAATLGKLDERWHVEHTNAWHSHFSKLQRCYEREETVIDAFFDLADAIITRRRLIREAWTLYRWGTRRAKRPWPGTYPRTFYGDSRCISALAWHRITPVSPA
jgi:hypothetical protein